MKPIGFFIYEVITKTVNRIKYSSINRYKSRKYFASMVGTNFELCPNFFID